MLKDLLQGRLFRHPLHPLLVHFPIGLFSLSLILDLINLVGQPSNTLVRASFYTMAFALGMATAAAVTGFVDWSDIRADHPAKRTGTYHMVLNLLTIGIFAVDLGLRYGELTRIETPIVAAILSLVGVGLLMVSGYLGGTMIFDDGIAVGRHRRDTAAPQQTLRVSSAESSDGFVAIASSTSLAEGATLRAEVDGCVVAVTRLAGQLYAFQDFCTHRYGPLSEGTFHDGQVMCPWHRSCFDVRTGKVTQGPAKVDLNVYEVDERDGRIYVRTYRGQQPLREQAAGA